MSNKFRMVFILILILLIGPVLEYLEAQSKKISGDNLFGCTDREYFEKIMNYAVQKDTEAVKQGLMTGISLRKCTAFKSGEEVFLVDTATFPGLIKVRRKGEVVEYWTNVEATE
jgi:hypothetical protein